MSTLAMILFIVGVLFLAFVGIVIYVKISEQSSMSPVEEAKYEMHPTLCGVAAITARNVRDIINVTIEDGREHPLLTTRKRLAAADAQQVVDDVLIRVPDQYQEGDFIFNQEEN